MAHVISKACTKCGACITECPTGSIVEGKTQYYIDADTCADHSACTNVCPVEAISLRPIPAFVSAKERQQNKDEEEEEEEEEE